MANVALAGALVVLAALFVASAMALISPRFHGVLKWTVTALWVASAVVLVWSLYSLATGAHTGGIVTVIGYTVTLVALVPLFGIGRLGEPGAVNDPNAPVLAPDQIAKVDAGAAIIVGIAWAVVVWRLTVLLG